MSLFDYTFVKKEEYEKFVETNVRNDILKNENETLKEINEYLTKHNVTIKTSDSNLKQENERLEKIKREFEEKWSREYQKRIELVKILEECEKLIKNFQWISIKDKLPEENQRVLCLYKNGPAYSDNITENVHFGNGEFEKRTDEVAYWMQLPEAPKE